MASTSLAPSASSSGTAALFVSRSKSPSGVSDPFCSQSVQIALWTDKPSADNSDPLPHNATIEFVSFLDHPTRFENLLPLLSNLSVIHVAADPQVKPTVLVALQELLAQQQSNNDVQFHETLPKQTSSCTLKQLLTKENALFVAAHPELSALLHSSQKSPLSQSLTLYLTATHQLPPNNHNTNTLSLIPGQAKTFLSIDPTAAETIHLWPPPNASASDKIGGSIHNNSLYGILAKHVQSTPGKRCLAVWLAQPLVHLDVLLERQEVVDFLLHHGLARDALHQEGLRGFLNLDLDALAHQLDHYAQDGPDKGPTHKALQALYQLYLVAAQKLPLLHERLESALKDTTTPDQTPPSLLESLFQEITRMQAHLARSAELAQDVLDLDAAPRDYRVRSGYKAELQQIQDELLQVQAQVQDCHTQMNMEWARASGRSADLATNHLVRLEDNHDEGWQFRLVDTNDIKLLQQSLHHVTVHRVLKNGVYFTTKQLRELATKKQDLSAEYDAQQRELVLQAMQVAATYASFLSKASELVATLDVLVAMAHMAAFNGYVRPTLTDGEENGLGISLVGARHPCVELQDGMDFIPNNVKLVYGDSSFLLVTGPNMGGKSTYIRSLGAIVTLAQIGSYVPCTSATINVCHHILARVGAGDLQERGISTFMAEMLESSSILRRATKRSLIIIDELGRGTSTFDGYGLAASIVEYIVDNIGCLTVFTTHFHELTALEDQKDVVKNYHVTAKKGSHGLTFLYEVKPGPCLESFGIQVAEMANVPAVVIQDAKLKARELENFEYSKKRELSVDSSMNVEEDGNYAVNDHEQAESAAADLAFAKRLRRLDLTSLLSKEYPSPAEKRAALMQALELSV